MATQRTIALELHRGAGSLLGAVLFIVLFSGCWSLGHDALKQWALLAPARGAAAGMSVAQLMAHAQSHGFVWEKGGSLVLPASDQDAAKFCDVHQSCELALDPLSGQSSPALPAFDILTNLHKSFFSGFPGRVVVSLFGLALLVLCVAGLWVHSRRWSDLRRLRRTKGLRLVIFDLHSLIGLWATPWLLLFSLTGALSGLGALGTLLLAPEVYPESPRQVFTDLLGPTPIAEFGDGPASAAIGSLDALLEKDRTRDPRFTAQRITVLVPNGSERILEIAGVQRGIPSSPVFERHYYQLSGGAWLGDQSARSHGPWTRAFIAVQPLHFAQYRWLASPWSEILRTLHLLMGLAATVLCASGLLLWQQRRQAAFSERPIQALCLRMTEGACGGLVLAATVLLAAAQMAGQVARSGDVLAWGFWVTWGLALLWSLMAPVNRRALPLMLTLAGIASMLGGTLHAVSWLARGEWFAWDIDLLLLACGLMLLSPRTWLLRSSIAQSLAIPTERDLKND